MQIEMGVENIKNKNLINNTSLNKKLSVTLSVAGSSWMNSPFMLKRKRSTPSVKIMVFITVWEIRSATDVNRR